jgi:arylsulfatase A-like enzyme/lysophospholipase L1-like esterase
MRTLFTAITFAILLSGPAPALTFEELDVELKKTWPTNRTINVLFHGHQIPAGYQNPPQVDPFDSYPHLFRVALKGRYPNAVLNGIVTAVDGETSETGAARFAADVLSQSPDLIVLDYALTDVGISPAAMETAWRAMIDAAQAAEVPIIALTPLGTPTDGLTDASTALRQRADLVRSIAASEGIPLADASLGWLEAAAADKSSTLLSPAGLPDRDGHELITDTLMATFSAEAGSSISLPATAFPRNLGVKSFTTSEGAVTFTTTNTFSGADNFLGDSGGTGNRVNAWDGAETLTIDLGSQARLDGFQLRWTNSTLAISGFLADPEAQVATVNGAAGSAAWNGATNTLTITAPWDNGNIRPVTFGNPEATLGATLHFSLPAPPNVATSQATFTGFDYTGFAAPLPAPLVHYGFENNAISGSSLEDFSGNGNTGTIVASATGPLTDQPGLPGRSFRFVAGDDPDGVVRIASGIVPSGNAARTIGLRFLQAADAGQNKLFGYGTNSAGRAIDLGIEAGGLRIRHWGGNITYGSGLNFTTGWNHVTLRVNQGGTTFADVDVFLNGMRLPPLAGGATGVTLDTAASPFAIGSSATPASAFGFDGWIDDFRIYGQALDDSQIAFLAEPPPVPTILQFTANPQNRVPAGSTVPLSWTTENADTLTLDPGGIDVTGLTTYAVTPTAKTTYTLTASNASGESDSKSVTLSVGDEPFPNIIVFFLDDFGWSDWQQNGAPTGSVFHETPHMNRLANEGKYFVNGYASTPVCSPTRGALMTGQAPAFHKITDWISGAGDAGKPVREAEWIKKLPTTTPNFASILGGCGYRTLNIGKWHLGEGGTPQANPLNFGFDFNIGGNQFGTPPAPERYFASANGFSGLPNMGPDIAPEGSYLTDVLTQQAVAQIRQAAAADTAFAMYLPHFAVHTPIQAPAATVAKYQAKLDNNPGMNWQGQSNPTYAAMVEHVDLSLGAILAALEDPDNNPATNDSIAENTLIIFTADNGGLIGFTSNRPLRDGKGGNYDGGIREPWVFWWPGKISPGIVQEPIVTHDLLPTVLKLADVPVPQGHVMTGQDLSPLLFGQPFERTRPLTFHYPHWSPQGGSPYSAVRRGDWKLIYLYATASWELYNLANDIGESTNLISTETDLHAVLSWFLVDDLENLQANYPRNVTTLAEQPPVPLVSDDVDSDGDGRSDFREAVEGTDPNNAQSFFQPAPVLDGGRFQIPIDGLRHRRYRFWESPDLTAGSWVLATTLGPLANDAPLVYQKPLSEDRMFFRIETLFP